MSKFTLANPLPQGADLRSNEIEQLQPAGQDHPTHQFKAGVTDGFRSQMNQHQNDQSVGRQGV
jgi:hypothetical protein